MSEPTKILPRGALLTLTEALRYDSFVHQEKMIDDHDEALRELVRELADNRPRCEADSNCMQAATCVGSYEGEHPVMFACDKHCGHGCEDGWCKRIVIDNEALARAREVTGG